MIHKLRHTSDRNAASSLVFILAVLPLLTARASAADELTFENDIRPVFAAKCGKCHGKTAREANLDLRTMAAIRRGGDSGPAVATDVTESPLLERIDAGDMPPEDQPPLTAAELELIRKWLKAGAKSESNGTETDEWTKRIEAGRKYWAFQPPKRPLVPGANAPRRSPPKPSRTNTLGGNRRAANGPDHKSLKPALQAWYRADSISLRHGERVKEWRDDSGNDRHLRPTWGRVDSQIGAPPRFISRSTIGGKAGVRFDNIAGLGSPPDNPVDIHGDAAWTITAVVNMRPPSLDSHTSVIVGFGDPAPGHNPGKPWASLIEIRRDGAFLSHSGGFGHDARRQPQTMWSLYDRPIVLTVVKAPGPMAQTTSFFINGQQVDSGRVTGVASVPDIQHRSDLSVYMGRANSSLGALRGDVAEVAIYNAALDDSQRESLEAGLIRKYDFESSTAVPAVLPQNHDGNRRPAETHPIDAFITARLNEKGLTSAPLADRRTLIRRAYFDLTGLPPRPEEVDAFVNDETPRAWERAIERLLHSKHYGERWGRHWLDVARYADTGGYETDIYYRNAWRFRDYVVKSFNDDKPYDQFVQEQIAGDEIWPDNLDLHGSYVMDPEQKRHFEALTGTGFYALGPQIHESNMDAKKLSNERLTDWVDTTASAFMALTFGCARCHDHKFDPITQRDYYSLQAVFAGSREAEVPLQHGMGLADWKQHYPKVIALEEARMAYRLYEKHTSGRQRTAEEQKKLQGLKNAIADRLLALPERDAQSEQYAGIYERPTVTVLAHHRPELAPEIRLLSRGELTRPKQKMTPGLPEILHSSSAVPAENALDSQPGRPSYVSRKDLALWLTRPDHPLTSRVMVNRIWQWHFGRGIIATPNDFGQMGAPPTHPELLDWLATEFVARGWSIKSMHRLIMTSRTYRQASAFYTDRHGNIDPDNTLLWRMNRRRLEGEAIWDVVHSVAGTINLTIGGRPVMPPLLAEELTNKSNWVESQIPSHHSRRGLYIIVRRNFNFPLFDLFDAPVNAVSCSGRDVSTVAPQALWLLNNHLGFDQAKHFAARLVRDAGQKPEAQVQHAWRLALGRHATSEEVAEAVALLKQLEVTDPNSPPINEAPAELAKLPSGRAAALTKFCLVIFNLNEFIYVD
ncbi:MAG: DUF1553 domain-containing protein [Planctomycetota bacterium]|jgi:cytochrome c553